VIDALWLRLGYLYLWLYTPWSEAQRQEFNDLLIAGTVLIGFPLVAYIFLLQHRIELSEQQNHKKRMDLLKEKQIEERWQV
jgi:hypothetical protein